MKKENALNEELIRHWLALSLGKDMDSHFNKKLPKKLLSDPIVQHHVERLNFILQHSLSQNRNDTLRSTRAQTRLGTFTTLSKTNVDDLMLPTRSIVMRTSNLTSNKPFKEKINIQEDWVKVEQAKGMVISVGSLRHLTQEFPEIRLIADYDADEKIEHFYLEGQTSKTDDHKIAVDFNCLYPDGTTQKLEAELRLTIIPDPKSLWKNLPSDREAPFDKPDQDSQFYPTANATLIASSVRGRSHAHKGLHRDDDICLIPANLEHEWNVLCVADGAGSCQYSRRGSQLAAHIGSKTLSQTLNSPLGQKLITAYDQQSVNPSQETNAKIQDLARRTIVQAAFDAAQAIEKEAETIESARFKDFSTTLLLAAFKPVQDGYIVVSFWIGDGAAAIYQENEQVILLGTPDSGEYAGQTRFLDLTIFTDGSAYQRFNIQKVSSMTALILVTDGITDAKFETEKDLGDVGAWDALWHEIGPFITNPNHPQGRKDLDEWMEFWSPGNHDDRSIAVCSLKKTTD